MDESRFRIICLILFAASFCALAVLVLCSSPDKFSVDPYSAQVSCDSGACTFKGSVTAISDKNSTIFYTIESQVPIDAVFFVGAKKPAYGVGDCVTVRGTAQDYQGKQSIVVESLRACKKSNSS